VARAVAIVEEVSTPKIATIMTGASAITHEAATQIIPRTTIAEMNGVTLSTTSVLVFSSAEELAVDKGVWPPSSSCLGAFLKAWTPNYPRRNAGEEANRLIAHSTRSSYFAALLAWAWSLFAVN
jgi:hypothetical protein